jgi:hypothetical protein
MSIIDEKGEPLAYGWNDIAAQEQFEKNPNLRLVSDKEFERLFPHIAAGSVTAPAQGGK